MENFAPVVIPTLNRHEHLKSCVESLSACANADKTELFVFLDYPLKDSHWDGYNIIKEYLSKKTGFKSLIVVEREKNFGPVDNFFKSLEYVFERYDRLIFSEDDNVFAPSFLDFVNKGLDTFKDREDIFSISGYNNPFPMPEWYKLDVYLRTGFSAWGVGIWKDKWNKIDWSLNSFNQMLKKKINIQTLKKHYLPYISQLHRIRDTKVITGDGFIFLYLLDHQMYSLCPKKTLVRNNGHDGSGVNCTNTGNIYMEQKIYKGNQELHFPVDLTVDSKLNNYILKQIQPNLTQRIFYFMPDVIQDFLRKILKSKF